MLSPKDSSGERAPSLMIVFTVNVLVALSPEDQVTWQVKLLKSSPCRAVSSVDLMSAEMVSKATLGAGDTVTWNVTAPPPLPEHPGLCVPLATSSRTVTL